MIHTVHLEPDWKLIGGLSEIDRFEGAWSAIEKREGHSLRQLKSIATVHSVGASTRIEGSKMNDDEVKVLLENLKLSKLEERDAQEVAGYFEALNIISDSYRDIQITENAIKNLHNILLRYSQKDEWHKGNYKHHSNAVEAVNHVDGSKMILFQPPPPGHETEEAMNRLVAWYNSDTETHPIVRSAIFVYDFLSIHPFQDGNGRLSRLLGTLLLLKHGYSWIQYVSFEHEIENRKTNYYGVLMQCQKQRPGEDVYAWVSFFLDCLSKIQQNLLNKLERKGKMNQLSPREKQIYTYIESHPGGKSGQISKQLNIPLPTVKRVLADMLLRNLIAKHGIGAGTYYSVDKASSVKKDQFFKLTSTNRVKEFTIMNSEEFVIIKKLILTPLFVWTRPDEWASKLYYQELNLKVHSSNGTGQTVGLPGVLISALVSPMSVQPVFTLFNPIEIPGSPWTETLRQNVYPINVKVELQSSTEKFDFEVLVVYDEAIS